MSDKIKVVLYVHGNKETMYEKGQQLGLTGDALERFKYALNEVEVEVELDKETGYYCILGVK